MKLLKGNCVRTHNNKQYSLNIYDREDSEGSNSSFVVEINNVKKRNSTGILKSRGGFIFISTNEDFDRYKNNGEELINDAFSEYDLVKKSN